MSFPVEKRALKSLPGQGIAFLPRQLISFNLFLPSENTGPMKFHGKLLMLPWLVTPTEVLKWPLSSFLYSERFRPILPYL